MTYCWYNHNYFVSYVGATMIMSTEKNYEVKSESMVIDFYRIITGNKLSDRQYDVLEAISPYPTIGKAERAIARKELDISCYNFNNIIQKLKKEGILIKLSSGKYELREKFPLESDALNITLISDE